MIPMTLRDMRRDFADLVGRPPESISVRTADGLHVKGLREKQALELIREFVRRWEGNSTRRKSARFYLALFHVRDEPEFVDLVEDVEERLGKSLERWRAEFYSGGVDDAA